MRVVEVGQYFVTKDTGDFRQLSSVACREYTLPRDDPSSKPKEWIQRNMRIGTVLEVIKVVAARSKAKAKPQPRVLVGTTATIPMHERRWIEIEPSEQNLASHDLSKKVINLLRHNQTLQREEDGAIEFYKIKFYLRNHHSQIQNWSDDRWKACLTAGGGSKRRYQYCSDNSRTNSLPPCSSRTFWKQSY